MSETPKAGEYFHREKLTVVHARVRVSGEYVMLQAVGERMNGSIRLDEFTRDYARNVPVTKELLEGMGFVKDGYGLFLRLPQQDRMMMWLPPSHAAPEVFTLVADYGHGAGLTTTLRTPATLRDLLNTLRILGVSTEAVSQATDGEGR